jgi:hypothetical protein
VNGEVETKKPKRAKKAKRLGVFVSFALFAFFVSLAQLSDQYRNSDKSGKMNSRLGPSITKEIK